MLESFPEEWDSWKHWGRGSVLPRKGPPLLASSFFPIPFIMHGMVRYPSTYFYAHFICKFTPARFASSSPKFSSRCGRMRASLVVFFLLVVLCTCRGLTLCTVDYVRTCRHSHGVCVVDVFICFAIEYEGWAPFLFFFCCSFNGDLCVFFLSVVVVFYQTLCTVVVSGKMRKTRKRGGWSGSLFVCLLVVCALTR